MKALLKVEVSSQFPMMFLLGRAVAWGPNGFSQHLALLMLVSKCFPK